MKTRIRVSVAFLWAVAFAPLPGLAQNISATDGVSLSQVSYPDLTGATNTAIGLMEVDLNQLRQSTGASQGYVNAMDASGVWIVKNLPVLTEDEYPYSKINVEYDLGVQNGTSVTQGQYAVQLSDTAVTTFSATASITFTLSTTTVSIGGVPSVDTTPAPPTPPNLNDILFGNQSQNQTITQFDHPNVEAAINQCMPMSVANSLQYLSDTQGLVLPHQHRAGLRGDDSLVGMLDAAMDRTVTDRQHGDGTWGLQGKLKYIAENNLAGRLVVTHWGVGGDDSGASDVSVASGGVTVTSTGMGASIDFDEIFSSLQEDQDCEAVYAWPGGAHAVDIVAAGRTKGDPWIVHASDMDQDSDSEGAGPSGLRFEYLNDPDEDGRYNLSGSNRELVQVICEKYVPPPPILTVTGLDDPAGHSCCVDDPPATVDIAISGTTISLTGSGASWLPMTGTIDSSGNFNLTSSSTVAGFSNVDSSFVGQRSGGTYTGTITVGTENELYGVPIAFDVTIEDSASTSAAPAVRANGFRNEIQLANTESTRLSISMGSGTNIGHSGDWWMVAVAANGIFSLNLGTMQWQSGLTPTYAGPLMEIPYLALPLDLGTLPAGTYDFYFGYDGSQNGTLDVDSMQYDVVRMTRQ
ncbi:MAG: hypothetical protein ACOY3Z_07680 [Thermodesulfobacteriota bacterium]